jgi:transposase
MRSQVWDLPPITAHVTEYQQHTVCCPQCRQRVTAARPTDMPAGAFGPRLTALIALLHGRYRLSQRETAAFLTEVAAVDLSLGSINTCCERVSDALAPIDAAIHAVIQQQPVLHVDETGWREGSQRGWLWVAVSPIATCFRIDGRRSRPALERLIGAHYRGLVHSDRGSAYHGVPNAQRQLCWAHLLRNLQGLVDAGQADSWWAQRMVVAAQSVFTAWHAYRCKLFDRPALQQALLPVRLAWRELLDYSAMAAWEPLRKFARDLQRHWDALWAFSRIEGLEPTNNVAERALRPAVLWRKGCFGTQSAVGSRFVERMLSVRATCTQQGHKLFTFLIEAVRAARTGVTAPQLLPTP